MNLTHLHLLLNHFPIVGTLIGGLVLVYGVFRNQSQAKIIGSMIIVIMTIIAIPVFFTGEPAEESVEHLQGISKSLIHEHEEAAELAIWVMGLAGLLSLASLFMHWKQSTWSNKLFILAMLVAILSFFSMAWVGNLGGKIRHTELETTVSPSSIQLGTEHEDD